MSEASTTTATNPAPAGRFGYALSLVGTLVSRLAMLAVLVLLPREIGLTHYGLFALVITLGEIIEMTTSNWYRLLLVRQSVNSHVSAETAKTGFRLVTLVIVAAGLAAGIAVVLSPLVVSEDHGSFALATVLYIMAFIAFRLLVTILQAQGRQQLIGYVELLRGILTITLVVSAVNFGAATFLYASLGLAAATAITALAGFPLVRKGLGDVLLQRLAPGSFASIGVPVVIATVLTYQIGWLDRIVLQHWMGPQTVGLYVAVIAIARQPIDLVLNALNSQTFPVLLTRDSHGEHIAGDKIAGVLISLCILGFGAAASIIALADPLARFALPTFDHALVMSLIPFIALGAVALGIKHFVFDNIFHAYGQNWVMLRWFSLAAAATLLLTMVLVPYLGPRGAALSFLLGSIGSLASSVMLSRRFCKLNWPASALLIILISAAIAGVCAWYGSQLVEGALVRLACGGLVFGLVYLAALTTLLNFRLGAFLSSPWSTEGLRGTTS
jgi:O-antigen/teichoic acid export membrane protein